MNPESEPKKRYTYLIDYVPSNQSYDSKYLFFKAAKKAGFDIEFRARKRVASKDKLYVYAPSGDVVEKLSLIRSEYLSQKRELETHLSYVRAGFIQPEDQQTYISDMALAIKAIEDQLEDDIFS